MLPGSKPYKFNSFKFYRSLEWKSIKRRVFRSYVRRCMKCGCTKSELHIDHIKPLSKYPKLRLDFNNLQILCKDCNMLKSSIFETDYREEKKPLKPKTILRKKMVG